MLIFLIKGVFRDRHKYLFPVLVVIIGVMLMVVMHCWITGFMEEAVDSNASFLTGHAKVVTRAYAEDIDQMPHDLALTGVNELIKSLGNRFPDMIWVKRIRFGGLVDAPDETGSTRAQGTFIGIAIDLSDSSTEIGRMNIGKSLKRGNLPERPGEVLLSDQLAERLEVIPGDTVTLIGSTMEGSMAMQNVVMSGTVRFGVGAMDRGAMILDMADAQYALDMEDAAGEILGFSRSGFYNEEKISRIVTDFNALNSSDEDEFAPVMLDLRDQNDLAGTLDYMHSMMSILVFIFLFAMALVLWNAALIGGLRRYGEVGVRLAIGENKGHVYRSMLIESLFIGITGSLLGTLAGLGLSYPLEKYGINVGAMMKNSTILMPDIFRARITTEAYSIGILPGILATLAGTSLAGIGIFKRKTAQLFKELEA